jgi:hypothetical protein
MFYNKPKSITNSFLNKIINYSILRSNLSLLEHYSPFKSRFKRASLKRLKKKLSKCLLKLKKKSSSRLRKTTKLRSLICGYNKSDM